MNPLFNRLAQAFGDWIAPEPPLSPDDPTDVACVVTQFITEKYADAADSPAVIQGLWLAMQMLAGPAEAARLLRECALNLEN